ncbi:MAG: hypothetical protein AAGA80_17820 [Cyanobacteria bacterium P01_F01_bin.143]
MNTKADTSQNSKASLAGENQIQEQTQETNENLTQRKPKISKQVKVTVSQSDAAFLSSIAEKLGISEAEVLRKGVKLMNLYAKTYDQPDTKLVLETADTKQDILVL